MKTIQTNMKIKNGQGAVSVHFTVQHLEKGNASPYSVKGLLATLVAYRRKICGEERWSVTTMKRRKQRSS